MQEKPHIHRFTTPLYDFACDSRSRLKLGYLLKYVQETSTSQLDKLQLPYQLLFEEGIVFLLAKTGLRIFRSPKAGETLVFQTSPQGTKGAQFFREVLAFTEEGERVAEVQTAWLIVNPHTRKILRPDQFQHELPMIPEEDRLKETYAVDRVRPSGEVIATLKREVRYSDIDVNRHLNNTVYGDIVIDCLPLELMLEKEIQRFFIAYHQEARYGEVLDITVRQGEDGWYYVVGNIGETCCFEAKALFG